MKIFQQYELVQTILLIVSNLNHFATPQTACYYMYPWIHIIKLP